MTTVATIAATIFRTANDIDAIPLPRVALLNQAAGARRTAALRQRLTIHATNLRRIEAQVAALSTVQRAKLDEIMCRLGYCDERSEDEETWTQYPDSLADVVRMMTHPADLLTLAERMRQEIVRISDHAA